MDKPERWDPVLEQFRSGYKINHLQRFPGRERGGSCIPHQARGWLDVCMGQWARDDERAPRKSFMGIRTIPLGNYFGDIDMGCEEEALEHFVGTCYYQQGK